MDDLASKLQQLIEPLAAIEHERWAHWQRYMHSQGTRHPDGSITFPAELVSRWETQISTAYENLDDSEKESDREQVQRYLPLIVRSLSEG